jgi:hypothetical protein
MTKIISLIVLMVSLSCTTIHFRSKNSVPVQFEGNADQTTEVTITGKRDFYFWGLDPEHHEVFVDEVVRKSGYDGLSKLIIYEKKSPQEILISFLTFGIYLPRSFTITGFTNGNKLPMEDGPQSHQ